MEPARRQDTERRRAEGERTPPPADGAEDHDPLGTFVNGWDWIGLNRALPDDLLIRLLALDAGLVHPRDLPPAVVDAAAGHPDRGVRSALSEARTALTAAQWERHLAAETSGARRAYFVQDAARARAPLAPATRERLAADPSPLVRAEAAHLPGLPGEPLRTLAGDASPAVRAAACAPAWPHLGPAARAALLADADAGVRTAALIRHHRDEPLDEDGHTALGGTDFRGLEECRLAPALALRLAAHADPAVRRGIAGHPDLPPAGVARLAEDADETVRQAVALRADLTEEERAAVRVTVDTSTLRYAVPWVTALHDDPEAMRRLAASCHPYIRSSVARARRLPPDVAALLARDEDEVVRLFLAESCDDAPADMLLEVWHWWTGSFSSPGRPRSHPAFPRAGLLRFAADPNPRLRRLALDDPDSTPELVEEFAHDPAAEVRQDAAQDPRLSPAAATRLLDDPDRSVRALAARHPALPWDALLRLLLDRTTVRDAVLNPALPEAAMRRIVDAVVARVAVVRGTARGD
ncbi:PE-PGRS family protein [Streptomyces sp. NPDC048330]|uniref:PE-PGRS family protein n=1 Tax=Streptomyces sp. NPDC048330 TaxID=3365533 RepID=UPI003713C511